MKNHLCHLSSALIQSLWTVRVAVDDSRVWCSWACTIENRWCISMHANRFHKQHSTFYRGFFRCIGRSQAWTWGKRTTKLTNRREQRINGLVSYQTWLQTSWLVFWLKVLPLRICLILIKYELKEKNEY